MATLRTPEAEQRYRKHRQSLPQDIGCELCSKPALKEFNYWKIVENNFPYDRIADMHHMIISKRHVTEFELHEQELVELREIKEHTLYKDYEYILEASPKQKSIPEHFHLHLVVIKED
jgi:hypothetical protein